MSYVSIIYTIDGNDSLGMCVGQRYHIVLYEMIAIEILQFLCNDAEIRLYIARYHPTICCSSLKSVKLKTW